MDAPKVNRYMSLWTPLTLWTDRVSILFTLISLIEKGDNRYNQAKDISKANIPMKIEIISYAVMGATSFPMYYGKPVS